MQAKLLLEGVRGRVYTVLQSMYEHMRSVVSQGGCISRSIGHSIGLRQGCVLSPLLFALFIADLPVFLARNGCEGIKLQDETLSTLFASNAISISVRIYVDISFDIIPQVEMSRIHPLMLQKVGTIVEV
jgi:hypothetical protein